MIYSVGRKTSARSDSSSTPLPELPTGSTYAVADSSSQLILPVDESTDHTSAHAEQLAGRILERIESRLPCRIRHLTVYATENAVVLAGECSTYYTKQIAQHAAMGALEYERLINNIDVRTSK